MRGVPSKEGHSSPLVLSKTSEIFSYSKIIIIANVHLEKNGSEAVIVESSKMFKSQYMMMALD
jgi:hypothetical protein